MNTQHLLNRALRGLGAGFTAAILALTLAGCSADSNTISGPPGGGGGGGGGTGPADLTNCAVIVAQLCVIGGPSHGHGLVDELLDPNGPLGPIAGEINADDLAAALTVLLANDDGTLTGLLQNLFMQGQLQEGLETLLLGDGAGNGGIAEIIQDLLLGNDDGGGIAGLLGEQGLQGLVQALLLDGTSGDCQAPLGTLCLVSGDGSQRGLVDLLLLPGGVLAAVSPEHLPQSELVEILGDMLASDGSLADLVTNLAQNGQLAEGLQALLVGDPDNGVESGLLQVIQNLTGSPQDLIQDIIDFVGSLFGVP